MGDRENEVREQAEARGDERDPVLLPEPAAGSESGRGDDGPPSPAPTRDLAARGLAAVGVALWCVTVLALGVNLAESAWEWAWIFGFGTVVPALLLWQASRLLTSKRKRSLPSARDRKKELLEALSERGALTPITAAVRTSLTADEAARMLEGLAAKRHRRRSRARSFPAVDWMRRPPHDRVLGRYPPGRASRAGRRSRPAAAGRVVPVQGFRRVFVSMLAGRHACSGRGRRRS